MLNNLRIACTPEDGEIILSTSWVSAQDILITRV